MDRAGPTGVLVVAGSELADILEETLTVAPEARVVVNGSSMWPALRDGDVATFERIAGCLPRRGAVVAFRRRADRALVAHRVVAVTKAGLVARGDACPSADGLVPRGELIGVLTQVTRKGRSLGVPGTFAAWALSVLCATGGIHLACKSWSGLRRFLK